VVAPFLILDAAVGGTQVEGVVGLQILLDAEGDADKAPRAFERTGPGDPAISASITPSLKSRPSIGASGLQRKLLRRRRPRDRPQPCDAGRRGQQ
jgi:hypothetical protein